MARIASLVPDLMFASKVEASLRAAGHEVVAVDSASEAGERDAAAIVADLDAVPIEELAAAPPPVLGFYPHVDVETRRRAEEAGIELVVPRSRAARELPELVCGLLG